MSKKYCYLFTEGNAKMRELLGGKGANLAEMTNIGLPVPQGFTITTEACTQYYEDGRQINGEIMAEIMEYIEKMEKITGKKFGDHENPLLVSVRSGARASMPGMMDTILNLGLNEDVVGVIAAKYFETVDWVWANKTYHMADALLNGLYPGYADPATLVKLGDAWLDEHIAADNALKRLIVENVASSHRTLKVREYNEAL